MTIWDVQNCGDYIGVIYGSNIFMRQNLILRMTHPSRNFFVLSLFCVLCMFVWLRLQGFESPVNKVFQKEKLVNSKTI